MCFLVEAICYITASVLLIPQRLLILIVSIRSTSILHEYISQVCIHFMTPSSRLLYLTYSDAQYYLCAYLS
ncbi:hypothetical protein OIDMADRAFT_17059 [Oidiodendron maius Zn]|uniref:Uncharacterized protein n=1 Tax=Oidiodendron maius (strain Zn) TaxID=913774 RepID=A0A0C3HUH5_OIDMZ|nr:hypothetical protein OIDMADRAFT_17059 [Oidiodendron maius Zn]